MPKRKFRSSFLVLGLGLAGAGIGAIYSFRTKPVYETVASVVLYRDRIENPNAVSEEAKNRWVWVRDGLTLTEGLLSDEILEALVSKQPKLQERYDHFKARQLRRYPPENPDGKPDREMPVFLQRLRREIKIDYTGGDSNTFVVTVKDQSPEVTLGLAQSIVDRLKKIWVGQLHDSYADALAAIAAEAAKAGPENSSLISRTYLRNTYNGLLVESKLNEVMAEKNFQVVRKPWYPVTPVWPKPALLILVGGFSGLLFGFFLSYLRAQAREKE